jgi:hypothetical protein
MLRSDPSIQRTFEALGTLLLSQPAQDQGGDTWVARELEYISNLNREQFRDLLKQAETQRVLRRTLEVFKRKLTLSGKGPIAELVDRVLWEEQKRVESALAQLQQIVSRFEQRNHPIVVMKTLDHWPDTGSDLDLLVTADDREVCRIFEDDFQASRQPQSWGDRLAHKFNFRIPGLRELVEVHVGCLGQTGEQKPLVVGALSRREKEQYGRFSLPVPVAEDRIVIAALQRMYRHYYIRLTDIVNVFNLLAGRRIDFDRLQAIAEVGSVWPGVATLLTIVCQHGARYGGPSITLPQNVTTAAKFNSARTYLDRSFVRVPLLPEATTLFLRQLAGNGRKHNFRAMLRLGLLPVLATAAYVSFRVTGNDKGVW